MAAILKKFLIFLYICVNLLTIFSTGHGLPTLDPENQGYIRPTFSVPPRISRPSFIGLILISGKPPNDEVFVNETTTLVTEPPLATTTMPEDTSTEMPRRPPIFSDPGGSLVRNSECKVDCQTCYSLDMDTCECRKDFFC